jgi:DNA-binding transcriptional MerR regulator
MKIGEVGQRSGLPIKTIRFYSEEVFAELTLIRTKAGEIEQKIAALRDLHSELEDLLNRWQDCGGQKPSAA